MFDLREMTDCYNKIMNIDDNRLIQKVRSLNLSSNDFAIMGTGSMFAHGLKELDGDIDLIARGKAWKEAQRYEKPTVPTSKVGKVIKIGDGEIEIFNKWYPGEWDIHELIDTAEVINGLRFVTLDNIVKWKKLMGRPKDYEHIKIIKDFFRIRDQRNST